MTNYSNLAQMTTLQTEQERIAKAIQYLESGGWVASMVCSPAPSQMKPAEAVILMPVPIDIPFPNQPEMLAGVITGLRERYTEIGGDLSQLGVVDAPLNPMVPL